MESEHKKSSYRTLALVLLGLLLIVLVGVSVWFGTEVFGVYKKGSFSPSAMRARHRMSRPMMTADQIQGWMTFHYIDYVFRLPTGYLQAKLAIKDANYPNITLDKYASDQKINAAALVQSVRDAVSSYKAN